MRLACAGRQKHYENLYAAFPSKPDRAAIHHRLLGHPDTLQDDMRSQCALMAHGERDATQAAGESLNWQLLLQVDSDENAGMRWAAGPAPASCISGSKRTH